GMADWAPAARVQGGFAGAASADSSGNLMHDLGLDEPVVKPYTYTPGGGGGEYAGFWLRFIAFIIDSVIFSCVLGLPISLAQLALTGAATSESAIIVASLLSNLVSIVLQTAVFAAFES